MVSRSNRFLQCQQNVASLGFVAPQERQAMVGILMNRSSCLPQLRQNLASGVFLLHSRYNTSWASLFRVFLIYCNSSVYSKRLHSSCHGIAIEDRIDPLHDVCRDIQKVTLVLNRNECASRSVIHAYLQRLSKRTYRFDIPLNAEITKNQQCW